MHSLHHKSLPSTFNTYCKQPDHGYLTRYRSASNYILPCPTTNRSQCSMKFSGPKAWSEVPKHLKEIAFRKPFSKKHKEYILNQIHVVLPPQKTSNPTKGTDEFFDLNILFETDDENEEFFGFDASLENPNTTSSELMHIFNTSSSDEDFIGFSNFATNYDLNSLFLNNSNDSDFYGF